ncbi:type 1 fimbrial protein, partial [Salmonella enterica]|nr:type 1 fimbrial protein [Salmonella enterica]
PLNTSGNVTIPLVARYIQTSPAISAGLANSAATFLINYK